MLLAASLAVAMVPAGVLADETGESLQEETMFIETDAPDETESQPAETESTKETQEQTAEEKEVESETETKSEAPDPDEKIKKTIQIKWDDNDDTDGVRPESIEVQLYADKEAKGEKVTLTVADQKEDDETIWEYIWEDLPKYAKDGDMTDEDLAEIEYTVKEEKVPLGYYISDEKLYRDGREVFTNTHKKINNTVSFANTVKVLDEKPTEDLDFEFVIEADPGHEGSELPEDMKDMPMPEGSEAQKKTTTVKGDGTGSFGQMSFSDLGVFFYKISEEKGKDEDYTYDDSVYYVRYTLKAVKNEIDLSRTGNLTTQQKIDVENGLIKETTYKLDAKRGILNEDGKVVSKIAFDNTYGHTDPDPDPEDDVKPLAYQLKVKKSIKYNDDIQPAVPETFTFILKPDASRSSLSDPTAQIPMPEGSGSDSASVSVTGEGTVSFEKIRFTKPGTYHYVVSESYDQVENYKYDGYDCDVIVTVTLNKEENKLEGSAEVIKKEKKISSSTASFTNGYGYGSGQTGPDGSGSGSGSGFGGSGSGGSNADTGDSTPVTPIMILMIAALLCAAGAGFALLRKKNK